MRKMVFGLAIIIASFLIIAGCGKTNINNGHYGSINIGFYIDSVTARQVNDDFSQVNSGKVFLKQEGVIKYQADLTIDQVNKTGHCSISEIQTGNYDIVVELYDTGARILYVGQNTVTINTGDNGIINISMVKNVARLTIAGSWTGENPNLTSAIVQLKKDGVVKYAGNLVLNLENKTVSGGIDNIIPGTYEIYVEIRNSSSQASFTGAQTKEITAGNNDVTIDLVFKAGGMEIRFNGDITAPKILVGPNATVNGQQTTISWTTDENATSNVCYATVSGFNYQIQTTWAPLGRDLAADNINHSVIINNLDFNTYYYVIVSADASGNTVVSDEKSFLVTASPSPTGSLSTPTVTPTMTPTPTSTHTPTPSQTQTPVITPTPTSSNLRRIVFYSSRDGGNNEIYIMDANGANQTRLTNNAASDIAPDFSPDRSMIVFQSNRDGFLAIYRMNADGSNLQRITDDTQGTSSPVWSPDGSKILVCKNTGLYIMNPDGSNLTLVPNSYSSDPPGTPGCPDWNGNKIVFTFIDSHIYVINTDGSGLTCLTNASGSDLNPSWSPNGAKIFFTSMRDGNMELYLMNADGSNQTRLTTNTYSDRSSCWSPGGDSIMFSSNRDGNDGIFTMKPDGTNIARLTNSGDFSPSWR